MVPKDWRYRLISWEGTHIITGLILGLMFITGTRSLVEAQDMQEYYTENRSTVPRDTASIRQLIRDAVALFPREHDSAIAMVARAEYYSRQVHFQKGIFYSISVYAYFMRLRGLNDSAIAVLKQAIPYTRYPELQGYAHSVYNNLAISASNLGRYEQALTWFRQSLAAMHVRRFTDNPTDSAIVMVNMAVMWGRLGEYDQAMTVLKEAEVLARQKKNIYDLTQVLVNSGEITMLHKDYSAAEYYFRETLRLAAVNDNNSRISSLGGLAQIYLDHGQPRMALTFLQDSLRHTDFDNQDTYVQLELKHSLGAAYLQLKEYNKAWPLLTGALQQAVAIKHSELIQDIAPDAARLAVAMGRYEDAYKYQQIYSGLRDSMFEQEKVRFLRTWSKGQIAEKDKTVLAQQLQIAQQHSQIQARNFLIAGSAGGVLLLLISGFLLRRSYRHKQKVQQAGMQQLQQQQQISRLKARVQGEEQERNRIATELHNGVAAQLWAARMNMDILQRQGGLDEAQQQQLKDIYGQLEETAQEVRNTAHNMMPALLLDEGLGAALASLCEKAGRNTGLEAEYQEYGMVPRLDPEIEHLLYRMVQELVQNTMKHAATAHHLLVQLSCSDTILNITVEDNGPGFTWPQESVAGIGLQHICRNVQTLKGNIDIKSSPGNGAAIYMEFDIQNLL